MKVLILGASGMLGHQLWRRFHLEHETWVALRKSAKEYNRFGLFEDGRTIPKFDAMNLVMVSRVLREINPDLVLNCIGIIKQLKDSKNPLQCIAINSLLPNYLADVCEDIGARLILFSTDCVYSGRKGGYIETDLSDAEDLYGRTKYLGEVSDRKHVITLRSSIIGNELDSSYSLLNWFLTQSGKVIKGYRRAIYSGFTTIEMAEIAKLVMLNPDLSGLWQVASKPISKYELLLLLREKFRVNVVIEPDDSFVCDRSLCGKRFEDATGYSPPEWKKMINDFVLE